MLSHLVNSNQTRMERANQENPNRATDGDVIKSLATTKQTQLLSVGHAQKESYHQPFQRLIGKESQELGQRERSSPFSVSLGILGQ